MIRKLSALLVRRRICKLRLKLQKQSLLAVPVNKPRQLLLDISVISMNDAGTGIQRIVRSVLHEFLQNPPAGFVVQPVAATRKHPYRYVVYSKESGFVKKELVRTNPGDVFIGLDLSASIMHSHRRMLYRWKANGVAFHIVIYDMLPLQHPEWFSDRLVRTFHRWIKVVAAISDSVLCISKIVKQDAQHWFMERYHITAEQLPGHVFPMGWDFSPVLHSSGVPEGFDAALAGIRQYPCALMVGTIEPRKGYAQILEAFEHLWKSGEKYNLVIVGRPGWKTEALQKKMRNHPQKGRHLFWFDNASDEALLKLYNVCDGVILASLAEGFGLPVIEARGHGKPILVRDLPVFREQECDGMTFFDSEITSENMASRWKKWLHEIRNRKQVVNVPQLSSWQDAAKVILAVA